VRIRSVRCRAEGGCARRRTDRSVRLRNPATVSGTGSVPPRSFRAIRGFLAVSRRPPTSWRVTLRLPWAEITPGPFTFICRMIYGSCLASDSPTRHACRFSAARCVPRGGSPWTRRISSTSANC